MRLRVAFVVLTLLASAPAAAALVVPPVPAPAAPADALAAWRDVFGEHPFLADAAAARDLGESALLLTTDPWALFPQTGVYPEPAGLVQLVRELSRRVGEPVPRQVTDELAELSPTHVWLLTRVLSAYLELDETVRRSNADNGAWTAARDVFVNTVMHLIAVDLGPPSHVSTEVCGAFSFDFTGLASTRSCDVALSLDIGGTDSYSNNAGGASLAMPVAVSIDLGGNDVYANTRSFGGVNGAGMFGVGILIDVAGDDTYDVKLDNGAANGAGYDGVGTLIDLAGADTYRANIGFFGAAMGAAFGGSGVLVDAGGADSYTAVVGGYGAAIGAALRGTGVLVDAGTEGNVFDAAATAVLGGAVGASAAGANAASGGPAKRNVLGVLAVGAGTDTYRGAGVGLGAAHAYGVGIFADAFGGATVATLTSGFGFGSGAHGGLGVFVDGSRGGLYTLTGSGFGSGIQGVGYFHRPQATGAATFIATGGIVYQARGAGVGVLDIAGRASFLGTQQESPCARSKAMAGSSAGASFAFLCAPDYHSASVYVADPVTGQPNTLHHLLVCSLVLCWFAADVVDGIRVQPVHNASASASGGVHVLGYNDADGAPVQRTTAYVMTGDRVCDFGCNVVT